MQTRPMIVFVLCLLLALAACQPQADAELPTLAVTDTPEPSASETPVPVEAAPTVTPRPRPPTWTPSPEAEAEGLTSQTSTDATAEDTAPPAVTATEGPAPETFATLVVCGGFGEDFNLNSRTFKIGTAPTVYWTPVEGAMQYRIRLHDEFDLELKVDYVASVNYTFSADLFAIDKRYGWDVYPIDALGQQMCFARGAELFPER